MNPKNRDALGAKVAQAAGAAVSKQGFVSAIDVFRGLGWLDEATVVSWRKGQLPCLERGVRANLSRISEAMKLLRKWAASAGLSPSETSYVRKVPGKPRLRFSVSGEANIERLYRTHWVSKALANERREKKAERVRLKAEAPVERPDPEFEAFMRRFAGDPGPSERDEGHHGKRGVADLVDVDDDWDIPF